MLKLGDSPFQEALDFFQAKVRLPTQTWKDIWQGEHARAFVVAGAMRDDLLCDIQAALLTAMKEGKSKAWFEKEFAGIAGKYGWKYKGGRSWRAEVIYRTNLDTAYSAGRYAQMKETVSTRPYWQYHHGDSIKPRKNHLAWDGLIFRHDDPVWQTRWPPNGWGCRCYASSLSGREMEKKGLKLADAPPYTDNTGIDEGWAYNVGEAAWGRPIAAQTLEEYKGVKGWQPLTQGNWQSEARPRLIPADKPQAKPGEKLTDGDSTEKALRKILGGEEKIFELPDGNRVLVNAVALARHIAISGDWGRTPFLPLLPELLTSPFEIWQSFERSLANGKIRLRRRIVKMLEINKDITLLLVVQANKGIFEAWTVIPVSLGKIDYVQGQRAGKLLWGRKIGGIGEIDHPPRPDRVTEVIPDPILR